VYLGKFHCFLGKRHQKAEEGIRSERRLGRGLKRAKEKQEDNEVITPSILFYCLLMPSTLFFCPLNPSSPYF